MNQFALEYSVFLLLGMFKFVCVCVCVREEKKRRPLVSWQISESCNKPQSEIHEHACMDVPGCYIKHMKICRYSKF